MLALSFFPDRISNALEDFKFREALNNLIDLARLGNKYLAETEPWKLIKIDSERVATILNISLQMVTSLGLLSKPFLPKTYEKLSKIFNFEELSWKDAGCSNNLKKGVLLGPAVLLFEKIEDNVIEAQIKKLMDTKEENEASAEKIIPVKKEINYDDFRRMDLRVGEILNAESVPKSNKLLKFTVDTGLDRRTIVSGVAKHFSSQEVVGKKVTVLLNLAPREIMGISSEGMILFAENEDGSLKFVSPDTSAINGAEIS